MTVKSIIHPTTGELRFFGCKHMSAAVRALPKLTFGDYVKHDKLIIPAGMLRSDWAAPALSGLQNILGNDKYGCCVLAAGGHGQDVFLADAQASHAFVTPSQALWAYSQVTSPPFDPPTGANDNGTDPITFLNWWRDHGYFQDGTGKIAGWATVDSSRPAEVQAAIYYFGGIQIAQALPDAWVNPFPTGNGWTWGVAGDPDPQNGHMIFGYGFNQVGVFVDTWAEFGTETYEALAKYAGGGGGGTYVVFSQDWVNKISGKSPSGLDAAALQADLASYSP